MDLHRKTTQRILQTSRPSDVVGSTSLEIFDWCTDSARFGKKSPPRVSGCSQMGTIAMTRPLRVGHVLTSVRDGGLERVVLQVSSSLPSDRFSSFIYTLLDDNTRSDEFTRIGIPLQTFGAANRGGLASAPKNLLAVLRLSKVMRRDKIDVVIVHDFFPGVLGRIASLIAGVDFRIGVLHSTYEWLGRVPRWINALSTYITDQYIAVSKTVHSAGVKFDRIPAQKIALIYNGVSATKFHPDPIARAQIRQELGVAESDLIIGSIGVIRRSKRQTDLVDAIMPLLTENARLHLLLLGSTRPHELDYAKELEDALKLLPAGQVHLLSERMDPEKILSALDVYAMPSDSEGFSVSLLEAALTGLPLVCSDIPPFLEVSAVGVPIIFHPVHDVQKLREALQQCITLSQDERDRLSQATLEASQFFSEGRMISAWASTIESACRH